MAHWTLNVPTVFGPVPPSLRLNPRTALTVPPICVPVRSILLIGRCTGMALNSTACPACGSSVETGQRFCPHCGGSLDGSPPRSFSLASVPAGVWRRGLPPLVVLLGAFLPWVSWTPPGSIFSHAFATSASLVSGGLLAWVLILVIVAGVAAATLPLWSPLAMPTWVPRARLAVAAVCLGAGLAVVLFVSTLASLISGIASTFGAGSPLQMGIGLWLFVLGALAWTVVSGFRRWD